MEIRTAYNAPCRLLCCHAIGKNRCNYYMKCHILKYMKGNKRVKILVFGERNWKNKEHIKKIRYVLNSRVDQPARKPYKED